MRVKISHYITLLFRNPIGVFNACVCKLRSSNYSRYIDHGDGKIIINAPYLSIKINKAEGAEFINNGNFRITPHFGGTAPVRIFMGKNSKLRIDGDFIIGQGVRIYVRKNASLFIGGRRNESDSGITSDTFIMVYNKITIGYDFVCAWNVYLSDSDWHQIHGQNHHADVEIGDHVWIGNSTSILKGAKIGNGSIVASHSKVTNKSFPPRSLIAGTPAKAIKEDITWNRDTNED